MSGRWCSFWSLTPSHMSIKVRCDVIFTSAGWRWRSTFTSTPGWKDAAAMRWKLRWTKWLRMLVYHISGRILPRTCQVWLYVCILTRFGALHRLEITQRCKFSLWCVHHFLCTAHSFPVGRNIICRLSFLVRMKLAISLPAHVQVAVLTYTCTVPVCHRL